MNASRPQLSAGIWGSVLLALTGIWLLLAPFLVGYQVPGQPWHDPGRNDVVVGGSLLLISVAALFLQVAMWLQAMGAAASRVTGAEGPRDERTAREH